MKLPRFLANVVRKGAEPEIVTTRNFDDVASILSGYARHIEQSADSISKLEKTVSGIIPAAILGRGKIWDIRAFASLDAAITFIGSDTVTLYITTQITISTNTTIPANISVVGLQGGSFAIATGATLTINGSFSAGLFRVFTWTGTGVVRFGYASAYSIAVEWFGAIADFYTAASPTDNTVYLQASLDAAFGGTGCVEMARGGYMYTGTLDFPQRNVTLKGVLGGTQLIHQPASFINAIYVDTAGEGYAGIKDFELEGTQLTRYAIDAPSLNEESFIDISVRETLGVCDIQSTFLADINIRAQCSEQNTWSPVVLGGITVAEWQEVYGDRRAPIMLQSVNACHNVAIKTYRIGSVAVDVLGTPTKGYALMRVVSGVGSVISGCNFEWGVDKPAYTDLSGVTPAVQLTTQNVIAVDAALVDFDGVNVEGVLCESLIRVGRFANVNFNSFNDYSNYCTSDRFINQSGHDQSLKGYQAYDVRSGGQLLKGIDSGLSAGQGWVTERLNHSCGLRYKQTIANGGPNDDAENIIDTFAFSGNEKHGTADADPRTFDAERLYIPKILTGYVVTQGEITSLSQYTSSPAGSLGHYINVTCGVMMREDGKFVDNKLGTGNSSTSGLSVQNRLRPATASKWYRVFVGRGGQAYLKVYDADPVATPEGNWIASFQTDASTVITSLANNPRINSYFGSYAPNQTAPILHGSAAPTTAYWRAGTLCINNAPSTSTPAGWICVTAGTPGTWLALDDFTAKSLTAAAFTSTTAGGGTAAGFRANSAAPAYSWSETDAATDSQNWDLLVSGGSLSLRLINGANDASQKVWEAKRTDMTLGDFEFHGSVSLITAGAGLKLKSGANGRINLGNVLVAGAVTVANTSVTANTFISWNRVVSGGTLGDITITRNAGVGYTITSSSATETSTIDVMLVEAT